MSDDLDMLVLKGTHGTCVSCAKSIEQSGFTVQTELGRAGKGIYFWAYVDYVDIAKKLALSWWGFGLRNGAYSQFIDKGCAILFAEISVSKEAYIDFNDSLVEDALNFAVAQFRAGGDPNELIDNSMLHKVHEYVINSLEEKTGCLFKVIRARVAPPPRCNLIEKGYIGNPNCYVVRDGFERIKLVNVN